MTLSEALFPFVSALVPEARVFAVMAPPPRDGEEYMDTVVIRFEGAEFTSMSNPVSRDTTQTIVCMSSVHFRAVEMAERLALEFQGFSGLMGGDEGVKIVDTKATELPEEIDQEHMLFQRSISLLISYEF